MDPSKSPTSHPQPQDEAQRLPVPAAVPTTRLTASPELMDSLRRWHQQSRDPSIRIERDGDKVMVVGITDFDLHERLLQFELFGVADPEAQQYLAQQLGSVCPVGAPGRKATKRQRQAVGRAIGALLREMQSRDLYERFLQMQMLAVHNAAMDAAAQARLPGQSPETAALHYKGVDRLMRTYLAQMETLRKYRHGGQQHMTIKHVQVNQGGQAIVGHIETPARPEQGGPA